MTAETAGGSRTGRAAATYLLLAGLQRGVLLLILPFISHAMPPAEYGAASTLTAAALLLVALTASPLESLMFRTVARRDDETPALLRVAGAYCYFILPLIAAVIAGLVAAFGPTMLGVPAHVWAIEILAVGFQPAMTVYALPVVQARHDLSRFVPLAGISILAIALSKLVLVVVLHLGVLGWVISDLFSAALAAVVAMVVVRLPRAEVTMRDVRATVSFSAPLIPHRAMMWAVMSLSRPALALVSTLTQVGLLSFGMNLASVAALVLAEINRSVLPHYSRETFRAPTRETLGPVGWQLIAALCVPALVGAAAALVGPWMFARSYWPSLAMTGVLLVGQAAYGWYFVPMNYLTQTAGLPKYSAIASGAGGVLILASILVFGRTHGAMGVSIGTTTGYLVMAAAALALVRGHKLDIAWRAWLPQWRGILLGCTALGCSVAALMSPVRSPAGLLLGSSCLVLVFGAVGLTARRKPVS